MYAAFFKVKLNDEELHHWLISDKVYSAALLKGHFPQKKIKSSAKKKHKLQIARRATRFLSHFPTIKLVAVTGSLAANNARPDDDIDLMIITSSNSLWLTRLLLIPLISLFFKRRRPGSTSVAKAPVGWPKVSRRVKVKNHRDSICLNLWLDESSLAVPKGKRNLYTAHEVLQAKPLFDRGGVYAKFILANSWTKKHLANAYAITTLVEPRESAKRGRTSDSYPKGTPPRLNLQPLRFLNHLSFRFQYAYMKPKITHEVVTLHSAYFHPRSLAKKLDEFLAKP